MYFPLNIRRVFFKVKLQMINLEEIRSSPKKLVIKIGGVYQRNFWKIVRPALTQSVPAVFFSKSRNLFSKEFAHSL